jgi:hypothetical protein
MHRLDSSHDLLFRVDLIDLGKRNLSASMVTKALVLPRVPVDHKRRVFGLGTQVLIDTDFDHFGAILAVSMGRRAP